MAKQAKNEYDDVINRRDEAFMANPGAILRFQVYILVLPCIFLVWDTAMSQAEERVTSLQDLILEIEQSSPRFKALDLMVEAAKKEQRAGDLTLAPTLNADANWLTDRGEGLGRSSSNNLQETKNVDATLSVPFATGTKLTFDSAYTGATESDVNGNADLFEWNAKVSQPLWRDAFGRSNELRRRSEKFDVDLKQVEVLHAKQALVIEVENAYWDLAKAHKQRSIYLKNLERRQALETWTRRRIRQFAAESQDLVQAQSLIVQLQFSLAGVEQEILTAETRIKNLVPGTKNGNSIMPDMKALEQDRSEESLVTAILGHRLKESSLVTFEAASELLKAKQAKIASEVVEDSLKPDLAPYLSYGANAARPHPDKALQGAFKTPSTTYAARVGVTLSMQLDGQLKDDKLAASRLIAASLTASSEELLRQSSLAWRDLKQKISFLKSQIHSSKSLNTLQERKVRMERERYQRGQTTIMQMTAFELDVAESEAKIYQLLAELRKTESLARGFVSREVLIL